MNAPAPSASPQDTLPPSARASCAGPRSHRAAPPSSRRPSERHAARETAALALRQVLARRRLVPSAGCSTPCEGCLAPHLAKVEAYVMRRQPIHLVLPAFPAKSPNPTKVLGRLPDMAERLALLSLQDLCDRIRIFHPPGARITICSDGHVLGDLVGVSDDDVTAYGRELRGLIGELGARDVGTFELADALGDGGFDALRGRLVAACAQPLDALRARIAADPAARATYDGIAWSLVEDMVTLDGRATPAQVGSNARACALRVIRRSDAWSRAVERRFPGAVRLSSRPQPAHGAKLGVHFIPAECDWITPWDAAAVRVGRRFVLMKRRLAESLGARVACRDGRPSHLVLDEPDT